MNNPISPEPISNAAEAGLQSGSQAPSAWGQQLLSRLVQPAGLMDLRHLPGYRTQAAAQTLLQRSQLPEQIQARYTTVEPLRAMAMPGRSRVESLALGSLDYPELGRSDRSTDRSVGQSSDRSSDRPGDRSDLGIAIGIPTLAPAITPVFTSAISRFSASDSESGSSSSESSGVPRVQLAPNPESPPAFSERPVTPIAPTPISTGSFRVSRLRNVMASSPSIDSLSAPPPSAIGSPAAESLVLRQLVNPVSSPLNSESGTPLVITAPAITSTITSAITPPVIARQPELTPTPESTPAIDRSSLILKSSTPNPIQANPIQANPIQFNIIQAMPLTPTPRIALNLPSSSTSSPIKPQTIPQIALNPIAQSAPTNSSPVSTPVPRISRSLLPEIAGSIAPSPATPLPLTPLRTPTGASIARMPTETSTGEISMPPTQANPPPSAAPVSSTPPPDIKRIAAQVSQLLQRQLTVEHERRGLKSW